MDKDTLKIIENSIETMNFKKKFPGFVYSDNDVDDLKQEAYLQLLMMAPNCAADKKNIPYFKRSAINCCNQHIVSQMDNTGGSASIKRRIRKFRNLKENEIADEQVKNKLSDEEMDNYRFAPKVNRSLESFDIAHKTRNNEITLEDCYEKCTKEERQILEMMVAGYNNYEISKYLQIAETTLSLRFKKLKEKLQERFPEYVIKK